MAPARLIRRFGALLAALVASAAGAQMSHHHHHHPMPFDEGGMVMNENPDRLPAGCEAISRDVMLIVEAGTRFARHPGQIFGLSSHEYRVPPCSRLAVTFINRDAVRHQWMVHGLPRTLYPEGMFHLEVAGGHQKTGRFIVPAEDRTYLVHCDMAQHMEKGMKAQLVVGRGSGSLWSIPGVSRSWRADSHLPKGTAWAILGAVLAGLTGGVLLARWLPQRAD